MRILQDKLKTLPAKPGVYQYKDASGNLLYVGKAKNLKNRVSSYFHERSNHSPRIQAMVQQIADLELIVTQSDIEALVLEASLIKTLRPKYNIVMRDDKKYPWLILTDEPFPRLAITREPSKKGRERCFGPYASPGALYQTLQLIKKLFPLRQRKTPLFKDRPCMNYHIGSCLGPCQKLITPKAYQEIVNQLVLFLKGQADDLLEMLDGQMAEASLNLEFEKAAMLRDRYQAVQNVLLQQRVMMSDTTASYDVVGLATQATLAAVAVLKVRKGRLIQTAYFELPFEPGTPQTEAYEAFLFQYYQETTQKETLPDDLILQFPLADESTLSDWLTLHRRKKVKIHHPKRDGDKKAILEFAIQNAEEALTRSLLEQQNKLKHDPAQALMQLQELLKLPQLPRRIECYDISHVSGTNTVASMVVLTDGLPDKSQYRRFKIQSTEEGKPDDFQSMREVMTRRFSKREEKGWPDPDLIIIDGGKGQLSSAIQALKAIGITEQPVISLAKKFEEVYFPNQSRPLLIERNSMAMFLLQKIRDEAHRFAITYHRSLRGKAQTQSFLDDIPGLGPVRKKRLLSAFPSIEALKKATAEEIQQVLQSSQSIAEKIQAAIQNVR